MIAINVAAYIAFAACEIGQGADCVITDISLQKGMKEANTFMSWAAKMRWTSYVIKFGLPIGLMYVYHELSLYANAKWGSDPAPMIAAIGLFSLGAVLGIKQAISNYKALKAFEAKK